MGESYRLQSEERQTCCRYTDAVSDARQVIALDRGWVKGWSRLAAALFALDEWSEVFYLFQYPLKGSAVPQAYKESLYKISLIVLWCLTVWNDSGWP